MAATRPVIAAICVVLPFAVALAQPNRSSQTEQWSPQGRGVETPDLIPTYNEMISRLTDRQKEIIHAIRGFEDLWTPGGGARNIFWCAERIPLTYKAIDQAMRAGGNVGWSLWGPTIARKSTFPVRRKRIVQAAKPLSSSSPACIPLLDGVGSRLRPVAHQKSPHLSLREACCGSLFQR